MGRRGMHTGFGWESQNEKTPVGKRRRREWIILKWILYRWGDMDWIYVAQVRDHWRALVHTVVNLRAP
jgi:hypothetical protein